MYIPRHMTEAVLRRAKAKGAVIVTGARQVGKTTLIKHIATDVPYISLDNLGTRRAAIEDPEYFLNLNPPPLFIDEIKYAPDLFPYIKLTLDETGKKGQFYLSGSQSFKMMRNVTESLAGRAGILELLGLSLREINHLAFNEPFLPITSYFAKRKEESVSLSIPDYWKIIHRGSMPELVAHPENDWFEFYADYVTTYIERDVRNLDQVGDEMQFMQFMTVAAAMTGQMLNLASLARDVGISIPTAKRWLSILQSSNLVFLLQPYHNNVIKRTVKTPKLYFFDTGLAAYLTRWLTPETLEAGTMSGHFFESFVIAEILKSYRNAGKEPQMYYFRDSNGKEIDLLLFENNTLYPLEIKQTASPDSRDITSFEVIDRIPTVERGEGGVICFSSALMPLKNKDKVIPLWMI